MAFCINCGSQVPDGAKFCAACGTPVVSAPAPAPAPAPEPIPEPVVEPAPEPAPIPVPEPVPAPAPVQGSQQFIQVPPTDTDPDLDMEGPPIVGNYVIPGMENVPQQQYKPPAAKPAGVAQASKAVKQPNAVKPPRAVKQTSKGSGCSGKTILIIVGAIIAFILVIVLAGIIIFKAIGIGKDSSGKGTGTALTELLDNAAATHYNLSLIHI